MPTVPPLERFMSKVQKSPDGCWLWTGSAYKNGYGAFYDGVRMVRAHRFSYETHIGPIPDGLMVRHTCDTPLCVSPAHLTLGTHAENMQDRDSKGRVASGDRNGMRTQPDRHRLRLHPEQAVRGERTNQSHLTEQDVRDIRAAHASGVSQSELGRRYHVSQTAIHAIVKFHHWSHVT